jgi:hypothetical protein
MSPDHVERCHQEIPENAEANDVFRVLHGMIRDSACPPSCRAPHEGVGQKPPGSAGSKASRVSCADNERILLANPILGI